MSTSDLTFDFDRQQRLGLPEAVLCAGKSVPQIDAAIAGAADRTLPLLLTRLDDETYRRLDPDGRRLDYDTASRTAIFGQPPEPATPPEVAIVAAGTSDTPAAREALRTLAFHGHGASLIMDVGVAGLWRLQARLDEIRGHRVVIVVAGMDGALVSVLGGLIAAPLIAVPTSTGYGAARGGETALAAALASCAPGVLACNIDNGYGAACAAIRILGSGAR
ncbi:MAG: nickel pincer cofactor biosynthesis protein LarB [Thalassobaculaceae bacterium]